MEDAADSLKAHGGFKRKRVAKACDTCRSMKSKCDGKWPECNRCQGYGYNCVYTAVRRRPETAPSHSLAPHGAQRQNELREAIESYETLLGQTLTKIPSSQDRTETSAAFRRIKAQADRLLANLEAYPQATKLATSSIIETSASSPRPHVSRTERYLGEVSDVRFFNLVKRVLQPQTSSTGSDQEVDSYEQDDDIESPEAMPYEDVQLPSPEAFKEFTDVYFSTIHLAFPFIPQSVFMKTFAEVQRSSSESCPNNTKLALMYVICAIGAYYTSFPGDRNGTHKSHEVYFLRALSLASPAGTDQSINQVTLLLAQCFYYLAVCRTDSCWATLGQTVRTAQSIGLHVEQKNPQKLKGTGRLGIERRRRLWYSIFVLDRLVSLQLGRPPAIHEDYCDVPLPSRLGDSDIDWDGDYIPTVFDGPSVGDYHLAVISFSSIVSQVLRDLYSPRMGRDTSGDLSSTKELDRQLIQWKLSLPRVLRFDLGHAFEKSFIFKRQRSMFAIKYHHLRALIHRPYLCYPILRDAETELTETNWPLVSLYEKTCIVEARETARLLHCISSEKDLVQDFPLWQMISCLICAGSILVVSSIFIQQTEETLDGFDAAGLSDDAETCLRVFEALSVNSTGARIARDMMEGLKQCGLKWSMQRPPRYFQPGLTHLGGDATIPSRPSYSSQPKVQEFDGSTISQGSVPISGTASSPKLPALDNQDIIGPDCYTTTPSTWPAEIVDSMTWSVQFFGAVQSGE